MYLHIVFLAQIAAEIFFHLILPGIEVIAASFHLTFQAGGDDFLYDQQPVTLVAVDAIDARGPLLVCQQVLMSLFNHFNVKVHGRLLLTVFFVHLFQEGILHIGRGQIFGYSLAKNLLGFLRIEATTVGDVEC